MGRAKAKLIAYRRVSTARQGASGLCLEGQDAAVAAYAHQAGAVVLRVDTEVETGRRTDRPELARALADGTRSRATLVIAKLDRLTRNTRFLLTLVESGVDVVFCDLPHVPPGAVGKFLVRPACGGGLASPVGAGRGRRSDRGLTGPQGRLLRRRVLRLQVTQQA